MPNHISLKNENGNGFAAGLVVGVKVLNPVGYWPKRNRKTGQKVCKCAIASVIRTQLNLAGVVGHDGTTLAARVPQTRPVIQSAYSMSFGAGVNKRDYKTAILS
jgi:hypothetical protein